RATSMAERGAQVKSNTITMNFSKARDNINNVYEIVRVIDRVLYSHVCNKSGSRYWKVASLAL
ncbi:hypothetical protein, partial [Enterobacter roggenkampii]|uniref:hypothetical protein n=1 Tax=Enterobacter roggenkampii TaxID=1812935 RepID=UPI001E42E5B9